MKYKSISKDIAVISALALCMAIGSYLLSGWLNEQMQNLLVWVSDLWFDADIVRIYLIMTDRLSEEHESPFRHPLFSIIAYPTMQAMISILGISPPRALRLLVAISAALWVGCIYIIMRLIGCKKFDATVFSVLAASSASSIFWFAVPETFAMGSISILTSLAFIALTRFRKINWIWYVLLNIFTLSITITNWTAGITVTCIKLPFRKFIVTLALALAVALYLLLIQAELFPASKKLFRNESGYILSVHAGGLLNSLKAILAHSMIAPDLLLQRGLSLGSVGGLVLSFQGTPPGSGSVWGTIALIPWALLLCLSVRSFFIANIDPSFRLALGIILAGQVFLHTIYGFETFLYSLHFLPLLIIFASLTTLTRYRKVALILALLLIPLASINNGAQFKKSGICLGKLGLQTTLSENEQKMLKDSPLGFDSNYKCGI
ncbi:MULTISPECIES: hypothetical protein [Methylomonas]|uniref:Glycosyltransferase RgtA/B/C/D-like domain-containing protein n=2 Tax=Methylomonas TaxID=416 RepID=A0A126T961_9GAMM|nr:MULTISPECIES: hypothetical protein [Methylomonas]AMK78592.1 hypothetical protein JT25_019210 [Methylomonas denitrificans]OAH96699.1 hypothetical protein A1342_22435 [Methylomonas methanica]TCV71731.1 hypothetical protein EDE11_1565 [Methylomonas methanica]